jgi:CPA1 family monovalent cation:H+ antiporter
VAGLYVSWNGRRLIRPDTRLQGFFIWDLLSWAIEALVFLLTGLQARAVIVGLAAGGLDRALIAAAVVSLAVIAVRFIWVYPATYLPRLLMPTVCASDPPPDWRMPFLVSFTGLRGAVSLIGALLFPTAIASEPFPDRDVVLFATYAVIVVTIVGLGLSLRPLVHLLGLREAGADEFAANRRDEREVRLEALDAVLQRLDGASGRSADALRRAYADRRAHRSVRASSSLPDGCQLRTGAA